MNWSKTQLDYIHVYICHAANLQVYSAAPCITNNITNKHMILELAQVLVPSVYLWHVSFESDLVGTELMVQARRTQGVFHIFIVIQDVPQCLWTERDARCWGMNILVRQSRESSRMIVQSHYFSIST